VQAEVGSAVAEVGRAVNVTEKIKERTSTGFARFALLRAGLRRKEGSLFCVLTARLKPCPDTCMVDGCGVAVQAEVGCAGCHKGNQESEN
jgi:deoxyinosine 3'endonuclease (endonuclease V)